MYYFAVDSSLGFAIQKDHGRALSNTVIHRVPSDTDDKFMYSKIRFEPTCYVVILLPLLHNRLTFVNVR